MLEKLPPRERQIVALLYERGRLTSTEIRQGLPDEISGSAIRAMLSRLEKKNFVTREIEGHTHYFAAALPEGQAQQSALKQLVKVFFGGSSASAATALLGMSGDLDAKELDELENIIAEARRKDQ